MYGIFRSDGDFTLVLNQQDVFPALLVDARNGAVRDGGLLYPWRALFHPAWIERADGLAIWRMVPAQKSVVGSVHRLFLIFYLCVLLYGAVSSTAYSLGYWGTEPFSFFGGLLTGSEGIGRMERSSTAWRPICGRSKAIMILGMFLMLFNAFQNFQRCSAIKGEAI